MSGTLLREGLPVPGIAPARSKRRLRRDIQGLRALAVGLVVAYHVFPGAVRGGFVGVDVFFVISGYLITLHLVQAWPQDRADVLRFWGNRVRRLLPASLLVIGVSLVASRVLLPSSQWGLVAAQAVASAAYVQNWVLSAQSVDYLAAQEAATPFQHFWSLSVEEQFYLGWPLLILVVGWFAAQRRLPSMRLLRTVVGGIAVGSLVLSVWLTAAEPASAYFATWTRAWEFAVGGLVALMPLAWRPVGVLARRLAWLGVAGIAVAAFGYSGAVAYPGLAAALPVVGTALVIAAEARSDRSPLIVLGRPSMQWLGGVSYSVYLWHWPLLVLLPAVSGSLGLLDKLAVVLATLLLAAMTKTLVEDRLRLRLARPFRLALVGATGVALLAGVMALEVRTRTTEARSDLETTVARAGNCLGAAALAAGPGECPPVSSGSVVPAPALAPQDMPAAYADGCWNNPPFTGRLTCTYGSGAVQVALVGNSHAGHWLPALQELADELDLTVTTYLAPACNASDAQQTFDSTEKREGCLTWGQWVQSETSGSRYDLVVTSQRQASSIWGADPRTPHDGAQQGYRSYLERWSGAGTKVLVIRDTPYPYRTVKSVPNCVAAHLDDWEFCSGTRDEWLPSDPLVAAVEEAPLPGASVVDLTNLVCGPERCQPVNGGVLVYFDASHLTATFARTVSPYLKPALERALD